MCLFRGKVKDVCAMLAKNTILALGSPANIANYVEAQHKMYNYTYPKAWNSFSFLNSG
jgi:hypothetical protein